MDKAEKFLEKYVNTPSPSSPYLYWERFFFTLSMRKRAKNKRLCWRNKDKPIDANWSGVLN